MLLLMMRNRFEGTALMLRRLVRLPFRLQPPIHPQRYIDLPPPSPQIPLVQGDGPAVVLAAGRLGDDVRLWRNRVLRLPLQRLVHEH